MEEDTKNEEMEDMDPALVEQKADEKKLHAEKCSNMRILSGVGYLLANLSLEDKPQNPTSSSAAEGETDSAPVDAAGSESSGAGKKKEKKSKKQRKRGKSSASPGQQQPQSSRPGGAAGGLGAGGEEEDDDEPPEERPLEKKKSAHEEDVEEEPDYDEADFEDDEEYPENPGLSRAARALENMGYTYEKETQERYQDLMSVRSGAVYWRYVFSISNNTIFLKKINSY